MTHRARIPPSLRYMNFRFVKIPAGEKFPFEKSWQKKNNYSWDDPEFQEHLEKGGNYGIVGGYGNLVVIDADNLKVERAIRENLPETFTVRTGGGGHHFYYICEDLDKPVRLREDKAGDLGDVQFTGKQVVGANSIHPNGEKYEVEESHPIQKISASAIRFALKDFLVDESRTVVKEERAALKEKGIGRGIPISDVVSLDRLRRVGKQFQGCHPVHGSTTGHNFAVDPSKNVWHCFRHDSGGGALSWLGVREGIIKCSEAVPGGLRGEKFVRVFKKARELELIPKRDFKRGGKLGEAGRVMRSLWAWKCQQCGKINETIGRKQKPTTCENPDCDNKKKFKNITSETTVIETPEILAEEIVDENDEVKFAYMDDVGTHYEPYIEAEGQRFNPRVDEVVEKRAVLLPSKIKSYESETELIKQIRKFIHRYLDVSEHYEKMASYYILATWVYDELNVLSFLRFLGDTGTGKSRGLNTIGRLCYKPMMVAGAVRPAPIYRLIEQWGGTLIVDEADFRSSDMYNEVITILNCRFERGRPVIRCTKDDPDNLQIHRVFGPTILATRREFSDKALESRCLTETMHQTERADLPDQLPEEAFEEMQELRNKLLCFRLKNKSKVDVRRSQQVDLGKFEPRLRQVTRCFLAVFDDPKVRREVIDFLVKHQRKLIEQRAATWEGMIVNAIRDLRERWKEERTGEPLIGVKEICEYIGEVYGEDRLKPGSAGKIIRSFGVETKAKQYIPINEDETVLRRVVIFDKDRFDALYKRYVPDYFTVLTDFTAYTGTAPLSLYTNNKQKHAKERDTVNTVKSVIPVNHRKKDTVFDIKKRLWKAFGVRPFKQSELSKHFSEDELERVNEVILKMKEDGEIRLVPMESEITVWELTPKE